jgi:hypothetical protein
VVGLGGPPLQWWRRGFDRDETSSIPNRARTARLRAMGHPAIVGEMMNTLKEVYGHYDGVEM